MKQIFKSEGFKYTIYILTLMAGVKLVWFVVALLFLPSSTVEVENNGNLKPLYYRIALAKKEGAVVRPTPRPISKKPSTPISAFTLLGTYVAPDATVVTVQKAAKVTVLAKGESIDGFELVSATRDEAFFEKNGKSYSIKFKKTKRSTRSKSSMTIAKPTPTSTQPKPDVVDDGGVKVVQRDMLDAYMKDPKDIWKDIGITEIKNGKDIAGFRVRFVRKGSGFEKLGLQRGDVILAINGERLNSYQDAFMAYKNIQDIESLTLTIKRKNQEMELDYEIK